MKQYIKVVCITRDFSRLTYGQIYESESRLTGYYYLACDTGEKFYYQPKYFMSLQKFITISRDEQIDKILK